MFRPGSLQHWLVFGLQSRPIAESALSLEVSGLGEFLSEPPDLLSQGVKVVSHGFVEFYFHFEAFGSLSKHEGGQGVPQVQSPCVYVCEELCDGVPSKGVFQVMSQFGVSKGNVSFLFGGLCQRVDDIAKNV